MSNVVMDAFLRGMENDQFFVFDRQKIYVEDLIALLISTFAEENQRAHVIIESAIEAHESLIINVMTEVGSGVTLNANNETAIHLAFKHKFTTLLDSLFSHLQDFSNYSNNYGLSHFHIACISSSVKIAENFLRSGVDVNARCVPHCSNYSPLHMAVGNAKGHVVELLLSYGADANARDLSGQTALHLACYVSTALYESMASVFSSGNMSDYIVQMVVDDCTEFNIAKLLIQYGGDVNAKDQYGNTPLFYIFKNNYYTKLKCIDPGLINEYLIYCNNFHRKIIDMLRNKQNKKIQLLLESGADIAIVNDNNETVLHIAVEEVKLFRQPPNLSDMCFNDTISSGIVTLLLDSGFNVNARNNNDETPLHIAISVLSIDIVNILLNHNAEMNNVSSIFRNINWIYYPDTLPCLEAVENLVEIIDALLHKGLMFSLTDNLSILKFFILNNTDCRYLDSNDENITYKLKNLLECGTLTNIRNVFRAISLHPFPEVNQCVSEYLGAFKISKFYMSEGITDCLNNIMFNDTFPQSEYLNACRGQSQALKRIMLGNGKSLHEMSVLHPYKINSYIKAYDCKRIVRSDDFRNDFYYLASAINGHIAKSKIRRYISDSINDYLSILISQTLPEYCCQKIVKYLSNEELINVCMAATLTGND